MLKTKRIMILGAGPFQLSAIKKAKQMGLYVITVDNIPENIGHKYSDLSIDCSTTEKEDVLKAAIKNQIDGISTFSSDIAIPTVGYICDKLGLSGVKENIAITMSNKDLFRKVLRKSGLNCPQFVAGKQFSHLKKRIENFRFPLIVKPVDTSGSRGVSMVKENIEKDLLGAFNCAKNYSRTEVVCIEEFLPGVEVGGDGILLNGRFHFIAITHKHLDGFIVRGHSYPTNITLEQQRKVIFVLEEICRFIGYNSGPLNFDVMVNKDEVTIIEMSTRNGGNGIPLVIKNSLNFDIEEATLKYSIGEPLEEFNIGETNYLHKTGSLVFGSKTQGILTAISEEDSFKELFPEVLLYYTKYSVGDVIPKMNHNGNMAGFLVFKIPDGETYKSISSRIINMLLFNIDGASGL